jgi:hypothetical protein
LLLLVGIFVAGIGWSFALGSAAALPLGTLLQAAGLAVSTAVLVVYVAGEDDYRGNGIRRWDAYDAKPLTIAAACLGLLALALLIIARAARRRDLALFGFVASAFAAVLQIGAFAATATN